MDAGRLHAFGDEQTWWRAVLAIRDDINVTKSGQWAQPTQDAGQGGSKKLRKSAPGRVLGVVLVEPKTPWNQRWIGIQYEQQIWARELCF